MNEFRFFDWHFDFGDEPVPEHIEFDPSGLASHRGILVLEAQQGSWDSWKTIAYDIPDEQTAYSLASAWLRKNPAASNSVRLVKADGSIQSISRLPGGGSRGSDTG